MNLIIVESPTKAKTISKFISKEYKVESSFGHIRDLPERRMGVNLKNFEPEYVIPPKSEKIVKNLKKLTNQAEKIILASDEDREGEAIAWHLTKALELEKNTKKTERIVFHEITKEAILSALKHPREININLVNAQQARRILDRLVGYELSPFLWKKVAKGLSAGRVQSVAVRLIIEREKEIKNFNIEEYWRINAIFNIENSKSNIKKFNAFLNKINGKTIDKLYIKNKEGALNILKELEEAKYSITKIENKQNKKTVPPPFTTSTLQIAANHFLGFSAKQTMSLAQKLYETGFITYMRTDSLNLSDKFLKEAKHWLEKNLGTDYALTAPRHFKTKTKGAQEAHEAIRPTETSLTPEIIKKKLEDSRQYRLYKLIWQRSLASQMSDAIFHNTTIDIDATLEKETKQYQFRATGQILKFDGYLKIYPEKSQEKELPNIKKDDILNLEKMEISQHFTKPPARYSDAGLVKALEEYGIGRPSTYAPTIATIIDRNYVYRDENKRLAPNDIAFVVTDLLINHFPEIIDYKFTANMEKNFDEIAIGKKHWQSIIADFYYKFHNHLEIKNKELKKSDIIITETSEEICEKCGSPMIIKTGRYGKYLACSGYPNCKNIKSFKKSANYDQETLEQIKILEEKYKKEICEKCGSPMMIKTGRYGFFLSCSAYPKCKNIKNLKENNNSTKIICPKCGRGEIIQKRGRKGIFYACSAYPECKNIYWLRPSEEKCSQCGFLLVYGKNDKMFCGNKECNYQK